METNYEDVDEVKEYVRRSVSKNVSELDILSICSMLNAAYEDGRNRGMAVVMEIFSEAFDK